MPTPPDAPTLSPLDRIRNRPVAEGAHTFAFDPNDAAAIADARDALTKAEADVERHPKSDTVKKARNKARKTLQRLEADCVTMTLTLRAIGPAALEQIQHDHPATEAQQEAAGDENVSINMTTAGPATIAASLVSLVFSDDPDRPVTTMSPDDATTLWESMSVYDQLETWAMVNALNARSTKVDTAGKG